MKIIIFLFLIPLLSSVSLSAQNVIKVIDENGLSIPNVYVSSAENVWMESNEEGYVVSNSKFPFSLRCRRLGYLNVDTLIKKNSDIIYVRMTPYNELSEILLISQKRTISKSIKTGTQISRKLFNQIPSVTGTSDFTKAIKILPGVQESYDFSSGFLVRGGTSDQNQFLIDNVPIYNMKHILGVLPSINNEMIGSIDFFNGPIPAKFGGRLSSTISINTKKPSNSKLNKKWRIGLFDADLTVDIPIIKDKLGLLTTSRSLHLAPLFMLQNILYKTDFIKEKSILGFYDNYNKITYNVNKSSALSFSSFYSRDYFKTSNKGKSNTEQESFFNWGNSILSLNYYNAISDKLFLKLVLASTSYFRNSGSREQSGGVTTFINSTSRIRDYLFGLNSNIYWRNHFKTNLGFRYSYRNLNPLRVLSSFNNNITSKNLVNQSFTTHIDNNWVINDYFSTSFGLRYQTLFLKNKYYNLIEPRISVIHNVNNKYFTTINYSRTTQSIFNIGSNLIGLTDEFWFQVNNVISPQLADIYNIGFEVDNDNLQMNLSIYYKLLHGLVDDQIPLSPDQFVNYNQVLEKLINNGTGKSIGLEIWTNYLINMHNITLSYTLSKTNRQFDNILGGDPFPWTFDRRHSLTLFYSYRINDQWNVSSNFTFQSGLKYSLPDYSYKDISGKVVNIYSERNNRSYPPYHRLDLAIEKKWEKKGYNRSLHISILNLYNHKNISFIVWQREYDKFENDTRIIPKKVTLIPLLASISYSREF